MPNENERVICNKAELVAVGDAIRTITGSTATYYVSELASQVAQLSTGGNYSLQSKSIIPTKAQQSVTPDSGYYGLSDVIVGAIPENYADISIVTASAEDVLEGKVIVDSNGTNIIGSMLNNSAINKILDATTNNQNYTIPAGYHSGSGKVNIVLEEKNATPTKNAQTIIPTEGSVLSKVLIAAIPDAYQDVTAVTANAADVLTGKNIVSSTGAVISGSMANNGAMNATINGLSVTSYTIPAGYHSGTGTVSLTSDIETALAAI